MYKIKIDQLPDYILFHIISYHNGALPTLLYVDAVHHEELKETCSINMLLVTTIEDVRN